MSEAIWIALAQIIISVVLTAWQISASKKCNVAPPDKNPATLQTSSVAWFFKNAAGFFIGIPLSSYWLISMSLEPSAPTKSFVGVMVLFSLWLIFNLLCVCAFGIAAAFRPAYILMKKFQLKPA